ncbi:MAG: hypothetical protein K5987_01310 [Lachnospiraceae bacterium]|nr:hypothetical protein [Lachnospiraceae bacterium]
MKTSGSSYINTGEDGLQILITYFVIAAINVVLTFIVWKNRMESLLSDAFFYFGWIHRNARSELALLLHFRCYNMPISVMEGADHA